MKNCAIIVQARMNSKRFPGKVMHEVAGRPILEYVINRLKLSSRIKRIIVATSREQTDLPILRWCQRNSIESFQGSLDNVAQRFKEVLEAYQLEAFVRVCADSPWIDAELIDEGMDIFLNHDFDLVTNILERTFPRGQSYEILKAKVFLESYPMMSSKEELEHVTQYFYRCPNNFKIHNVQAQGMDFMNTNLCVDTPEDMDQFAGIVRKLDRTYTDYRWDEVVKLYAI